MQDIGIHSLVDRQVAWSRFTHWGISQEEVLRRVQENWDQGKQGYRPGVYLVPVPPDGFYSPVVVLKPGDVLAGKYEARQEGEEPRMTVGLAASYDRKAPAVGVSVILYHKDVLAEDGEVVPNEWSILTINARITEEEEPMTVGTLLANHFHISGGTVTGMTPVEFEAALRTSYLYWRDKSLLG